MFTNLSLRTRAPRASRTAAGTFNSTGGQGRAPRFVFNSPVPSAPVEMRAPIAKRTYQEYARGTGGDTELVRRHPTFPQENHAAMLSNWADEQDEVFSMKVTRQGDGYHGVVEIIGMTIMHRYPCSSKALARAKVANMAAWFVFFGSQLVEKEMLSLECLSTDEVSIAGVPTTLDAKTLNTMTHRRDLFAELQPRPQVIPKPKFKPVESCREARFRRQETKSRALAAAVAKTGTSYVSEPAVNRSVFAFELPDHLPSMQPPVSAFTFELPYHFRKPWKYSEGMEVGGTS
ncbi:uncharacterized protein PAC_04817 [Phialocephala subalpina]|uniref:Uncharacterized protein n=1 Tax=Phialocephala subalpina TaxID=576137 RepID=A0A1L7WQ80_9HELO|nr:uncharacterized protein PAC_04817 [Phialocephala subalpina]